MSIEEALAAVGGGGSAPAPPRPAPVRKAVAPAPAPASSPKATAPPPAPTPPAPPASSEWRERLHKALMDMDMMFTADAIEHSEVGESNGELHFTTPEEFKLAMNEKDILKVVQKVAGRPMRIKITFGVTNVTESSKPKPIQDEVSERALANAEVRRFQEVFPDAEVRTVRNLKD